MTVEPARSTAVTGSIEGVLLLDKPSGMTSNAALQAVRRLFARIKAGHTGTLDPLATGLLPICLGEATKFSGGLLDADKIYDAVIRLGVATTTGDADGDPLFEGSIEGCLERVPETLDAFRGEIDQIPPMFSAIKHRGRPLYSYARAGEAVDRKARRISIRRLELLTLAQSELVIRVHCSKGTYIRTLAHDIGARLGCGAHLRGLRRIATAGLTIEDAVTLETLAALSEAGRQQALRPADLLLADLPAVRLDALQAAALLHGRPVPVTGKPALAGQVRLYGADGTFLGLGIADGHGRVLPKRLRSAAAGPDALVTCDVA
jgi:tRNA pseudouridine55 synthase